MSLPTIPVIPMMQGKLALCAKFKTPNSILICLKHTNGSFEHAQIFTEDDTNTLKDQVPFLAFEFPSIETAVDFAKSFYSDIDHKIQIRDLLLKQYQTYLKKSSY